jgi:hypothetical protein
VEATNRGRCLPGVQSIHRSGDRFTGDGEEAVHATQKDRNWQTGGPRRLLGKRKRDRVSRRCSADRSSSEDVSSDGKWLLYDEAKAGDLANGEVKGFSLAPRLKPFRVLEPGDDLGNARLKPGSNDWLA